MSDNTKKPTSSSENSAGEDKAKVRFPPPLVYLIAVLAGYLLDRYVVALPIDEQTPLRIASVVLFVVFGALFLLMSFSHFKRTGQKPEPWTSTPEIITVGIYRYTRNPMYVGMGLLQLAFAFGLNSLWIAAFTPLSLFLVYLIAVRHEEAYLESKFGDSYREYLKSVRRWL